MKRQRLLTAISDSRFFHDGEILDYGFPDIYIEEGGNRFLRYVVITQKTTEDNKAKYCILFATLIWTLSFTFLKKFESDGGFSRILFTSHYVCVASSKHNKT